MIRCHHTAIKNTQEFSAVRIAMKNNSSDRPRQQKACREAHHEATNWPCRAREKQNWCPKNHKTQRQRSKWKTFVRGEISYIQIDDDLNSFMCARAMKNSWKRKKKAKCKDVDSIARPESTKLTSRTPSCISPDETMRKLIGKRGNFKNM